MINVFKNRTRLYALTTSALFFLQAVDVSYSNGLEFSNDLNFSNGLDDNGESFDNLLLSQGRRGSGVGVNGRYDNDLYSQNGYGANSLYNGVHIHGGSYGTREISNVISTRVPPRGVHVPAGGSGGYDFLQGKAAGETSPSRNLQSFNVGTEQRADSSVVQGAGEVRSQGVSDSRSLRTGGKVRSSDGTSQDARVTGDQGASGRNREDDHLNSIEFLSGMPADVSDSVCKVGDDQGKHFNNYNLQHRPIVCSGGVYTAKKSLIKVGKYDENPVSTKGGEGNKRTDIKLEKMSLWGKRPSSSDDFESPIQYLLGSAGTEKVSDSAGKGSAVFATNIGSRVRLDESSIKTFAIGLHADHGGWITMKGGKIKNVDIGAFANNFSSIFLGDVEVDVGNYKTTSEDDSLKVGLFANNHSGIMMKSGSIAFPRAGGIGVVSSNGSAVNLNGVKVKINNSKGENNAASFVFLSDMGGFISFEKGHLDIHNVPLFWIRDEVTGLAKNNNISSLAGVPIPEPSNAISSTLTSSLNSGFHVSGNIPFVDTTPLIYQENGEHSLGAYIKAHETYGAYQAYQAKNEAFDDVVSTISLILKEDSSFSKDSLGVSASIRSSEIKLNGDTYGIFFDKKEAEGEEIKRSLEDKSGSRTVLLKNSNFKVPNGVAIFGLGLSGSVLLKEKSALAGKVLLEAEASSNMSVFAYDSLIEGSARVDENSNAKFFLQGSEWHLAKNKSQRLLSPSCLDSCISYISLKDSNIWFMTQISQDRNSQGENKVNHEYTTLRIGKGSGVVFSTQGYSKVHFNVNLDNNGVNNKQLSDRFLIHGNVDGKTKVSVHDTSDNSKKQEGGALYSVSLIQVFGEAERDSFTLEGGYVTRKGAPYKYVLRGYGPSIPAKMDYFDRTLVKNSKDVWDFRLESESIPYESDWSVLKIPVSTVSAPKGTETSVTSDPSSVTDSDISTPSENSVLPSSTGSVSLARADLSEDSLQILKEEDYGNDEEAQTPDV
ncbi:hypothetical protein ABID23_001548 [Bartonella silvatica]|uniref:Autotransporter outer membrane beta-barrel domain-containing protein n=1 Tax=Bartonella silvatica TaxID=357760 RepID=A0ABV2HIQ4_9HYPH